MAKTKEYIWEIDLYLMDDVFKKHHDFSSYVKNNFYVIRYNRDYKRTNPSKIILCQPQFDKYILVKSGKMLTLHELILQNKVKNLGIPDDILNNLLIINKSILLNKPLNKKITFSIEGEE
jgi:hypothetical protein